MSDLISREAAIDALRKALYAYEDKTEKQFQGSDELDVSDWIVHRIFVQNMNVIDRETILALPSAQPERWIPVTESLPEDNEYVLVTTAEGGVTDAKYWHRERIWVKGLAIVNVTAWMSLPNPWRGEEE